MRDRRDPTALFDRLRECGRVVLHGSEEDRRDAVGAAWRPGEVISAATNDEAAAINARIRALRVASGAVADAATVTAADGMSVGVGDIIQARRNDGTLGVANQENFTVQQIDTDGTVWAAARRDGQNATRTVRIPASYVGKDVQLGYASTAYGVQGVTAASAHTVLEPSTSGAGIYVGMTRGRQSNTLHIVGATTADAREQFINVLERDRADRGLAAATRDAREAGRDLAPSQKPRPIPPRGVARSTHAAQLADFRRGHDEPSRLSAHGLGL